MALKMSLYFKYFIYKYNIYNAIVWTYCFNYIISKLLYLFIILIFIAQTYKSL